MTWLIVAIAIVVVLAAAAAYKWSQSAALRTRYGAEYERILALEGGDQRKADAALRERTKRRAALDVHELDANAHTRYRDRWYAVQGHFVDDPRAAVAEAADLVRSVLRDRGYRAEDPAIDDAEARIYDELDFVAIDHPEATSKFRGAQEVERTGGSSTEQLRQAFQGYKSLFEAVLVRRDDGADTDGSDGDRVVDLRRDHTDDVDDTRDTRDTRDADETGDGSTSTGGFLGRFRRQPAEHEIR